MPQKDNLRIRDIFNPRDMHTLLVYEKDTIRNAIRHFAEDPCCGGIFIIDKDKRFKGVITRYDLLTWAKFKIGAGIESDAISIEEIHKYVHSTKIKEFINKYNDRIRLTLDNSLLDALNMMLSEDLITVPVVDERGKILGDLKLSEVLTKILDIKRD